MNRPGWHCGVVGKVLLGVALVLTCGCRAKKPASSSPYAVPVVAAEVLVRDQAVYIENIGQTLGAQDVEIRARVAGFLDTVSFTEGSLVTNNQLLYTIDARPFRATLSQAEAGLAQAKALWEKAQRDTNRLGPLWTQNAISRQQLDDAIAAERSAAASLQAAEANVETARIQLGYTEIRSPIQGIAGKTEVKPGNLVGQGQATLLTTISSIDPIHYRFSISEADYLAWARKHPPQASDGRRAVFELVLADGTLHPHKGTAVFGDREVDSATGTLLLEALFPNPEGLLRPGQFGRVRFPVRLISGAVLVLQRCVQELQATYSVFVVQDSKAQFRKIELGPRVDNYYVVAAGLKAGELVVVEGMQKLTNTSPVSVTMTNMTPASAALAGSQ
ncbi:MAG: efflux RND transporter periplasmic adaptor subunit [Verrucomicrobiia bacterium]